MSSSKRIRASIVVSDYVRTAIVYLTQNSEYMDNFKKDPLGAIDKYSEHLGFSSKDLPDAAKDFLKSLTPAEVDNLKNLYDKLEQYGLDDIVRAL
jgi:hypothetical protein